MILALDTYYFEEEAKTVGLEFANWTDSVETNIYSETLKNVEEYTSGEFYKRELPCILSLMKRHNLKGYEAIIVDGFVYLDDDGKFGLGGYLYERLNREIPLIGVAKTNFFTINKNKKRLLRGESNKPLFITSIGMDLNDATERIKIMDGAFRIPTLLKKLDRLTREK
jgi:exodeoxyribonuclease-5/deoxyribonuclease V